MIKYYRKLLIVSALVIMIVAVTGCSGGGAGGTGTPTVSQSPTLTPAASATPSVAPSAAPSAGPSAGPAPADLPPREGEAAWYTVAEATAKAWRSDAAFAQAWGNNTGPDGSTLPLDGRLWQWNYRFISLDVNKTLDVLVQDGRVVQSTEKDLFTNVVPSKSMIDQYRGLLPFETCKVGSDRAVRVASDQYRALTGRDPGGLPVSYWLKSINDAIMKEKKIYWVFYFDKGINKTEVKVDGVTGSVMKSD